MKKPALRKKAGRPSKYSPELLEVICARLSLGEPLAQICRTHGMPHDSNVWEWCQADENIAGLIARARERGGDAIAQDALRIADDLTDDPASRRVRTETRLKLLAKWFPKRYGDRVEVGVEGKLDVTVRIGGGDAKADS